MMNHRILKQHYFLLLLLICIASCNQESKTNPATNSKLVRSNFNNKCADVICSLLDKSGNLWFCITGQGVYRYADNSFANYTQKEGLCSNDIFCMIEDKSGILWFGTAAGVCRYDPSAGSGQVPADALRTGSKTFTPFKLPEAEGSSADVFCMLQDKAGNIWFGTDHGAYCWNGKSFTHFILEGSYSLDLLLKQGVIYNKRNSHNIIQCIAEDDSGNIWFGSRNELALWKYNPLASLNTDAKSLPAGQAGLINFTGKDGLTDNIIQCITKDKKGNIWIGTRNHGVCLYENTTGKFTNFTDKTGLSLSWVNAILEDKSGKLWFATESNGVWCYNGQFYSILTEKDGLNSNSIISIVEDKTGNLWFGNRDFGLSCYDGKTFKNY